MEQQGFDINNDENGCGLIVGVIIIFIALMYLLTK